MEEKFDLIIFLCAIGFLQTYPTNKWQFRWAAMTLKSYERIYC